MQEQTLTVVVGTIGVGKSTYTHNLAQSERAHEVKMDELFKENPFFPLAVKSRRRWSLASDLWFLKKRVDMYSIIPAMLESAPVVVDSGLPMSLAYAASRVSFGYLSKQEYELYTVLASDLLKAETIPDVIVHLKSPIEVIKNRIYKRGRDFEIKYFTEEYIQGIADSVERVLERYDKVGVRIEQVLV